MRTSILPLIALLAGCGGGGSDSPSQVSASPEAPAAAPSPPAAAPAPTPSAPPIASPGKVPEPASPPVAQPPAQPPANNPPAAQPPANPTGYVSGQVLLAAMSAHGVEGDPAGSPWMASSTTMPSYRFYGFNMASRNRANPVEPMYFSSSSPYDTGSPYKQVTLYSLWDNGIRPILKTSVQSVELYRGDAPLTIDPAASYPLDQTVGTWTALPWTSAPWFASLILQSEGNAGFRVCWNANLPDVLRLWCTKHDRDSGAFRGIYVVDDSPGMGRHEWGTR